MLYASQESSQAEAVDHLMQLAKTEYQTSPLLKDDEQEFTKMKSLFSSESFASLISAFITKEPAAAALAQFKNTYLNVYDDVKLFTFFVLTQLNKQYLAKTAFAKLNVEDYSKRVLDIVDEIGMPTHVSQLGTFYFVKKNDGEQQPSKKPKVTEKSKIMKLLETYKQQFGQFWISYLQTPNLPMLMYQQVLLRMEHIIKHMDNPFLLNDFITASFNRGGYISLLSIKSIFVLMTQYNLVYPEFYTKLYSILSLELFKMDNSKEFYSLLIKFLSSTHLPVYIVAAFIKKLARISLHAPAHAVVYIIVLIYELILRHPETRPMIHRVPTVKSNGPLQLTETPNEPVFKGEDVFNMNEPIPKKSKALESTLWELESHAHHYDPVVRKYATTFRARITDGSMTFPKPEEFVGLNYEQLISKYEASLAGIEAVVGSEFYKSAALLNDEVNYFI